MFKWDRHAHHCFGRKHSSVHQGARQITETVGVVKARQELSSSGITMLVLVVILVALSGPGGRCACSQTASPIESGQFTPKSQWIFGGSTQVNLVNLSFSVSDAKGSPVHGLKVDDIRVLEDGKTVEISNFEEFRSSFKSNGVDSAQGSGVPRPVTPPRALLAVVVDNNALELHARNKFLQQLAQKVRKIDLQGNAVTLALVGSSPDVRVSASMDRPEIENTIAEISKTTAAGDFLQLRHRAITRQIGKSLDPDLPLSQIQLYCQQERDRISSLFEQVSTIMADIAAFPGRKELLLVTRDIPTTPGMALYETLYETQLKRTRRQPRRLDPPGIWAGRNSIRDLIEDFADKVLVSGIEFSIADIADRSIQATAETNFQSMRVSPILTPQIEGELLAADLTGGEAFSSSRDGRAALERTWNKLTDYYSLGYVRSAPPDGKLHEIEIRVKDLNLRVNHPSKILAETRQQRFKRSVRAALFSDDSMLWQNRELVSLDILGVETTASPTTTVSIMISVPAEKFIFSKSDGSRNTEAEIGIQALLESSRLSEFIFHKTQLHSVDDTHLFSILKLNFEDYPSKIAIILSDSVGSFEGINSVVVNPSFA